ncbi:MAG TPA: aspartyl/asparaginyl beta-hydroxylase domain-containing protein [Gammaproteobacteria bacterium]
MWTALAAGSALAFVIGSMVYVCQFRGASRYTSVTEYLRKSWPVFAPLNCLLYLFTHPRGRKPIPSVEEFPELAPIREQWQAIRDEAIRLHEQRQFELTVRPDSPAHYDIGFRTFFKHGWSKFYLKWYGYTYASARTLCPDTVAIIEGIPSVNAAMFSLLPPGAQLTRHADPMACSLRYHLGLATPNSDNCFINVDGVAYSWRDGTAFMFDETYPHFARNDSDQYRLILMCDIDRPLRLPGRIVNFFYKQLAKLLTVPNTEGDRRGLGNVLFATLAPVAGRVKKLKYTNRPLYLCIKYAVNLTVIALLLLFATAVLQVLFRFAALI